MFSCRLGMRGRTLQASFSLLLSTAQWICNFVSWEGLKAEVNNAWQSHNVHGGSQGCGHFDAHTYIQMSCIIIKLLDFLAVQFYFHKRQPQFEYMGSAPFQHFGCSTSIALLSLPPWNINRSPWGALIYVFSTTDMLFIDHIWSHDTRNTEKWYPAFLPTVSEEKIFFFLCLHCQTTHLRLVWEQEIEGDWES